MEDNVPGEGLPKEGMERRAFLQRAAIVSGATLWAAPTVQSIMAPAFATGTGACPPGHLVRFKFDVNDAGTGGAFDSGDADGNGASWCLPDGYADADVSVNSSGCYSVAGASGCITVTLSNGGKTASVKVPPGVQIEDLVAKAGSWHNGECDDVHYETTDSAIVELPTKGISFVAGVICV